MAQSGNCDGLATQFCTTIGAVDNRVVATSIHAIRSNVVFNNCFTFGVAQGGLFVIHIPITTDGAGVGGVTCCGTSRSGYYRFVGVPLSVNRFGVGCSAAICTCVGFCACICTIRIRFNYTVVPCVLNRCSVFAAAVYTLERVGRILVVTVRLDFTCVGMFQLFEDERRIIILAVNCISISILCEILVTYVALLVCFVTGRKTSCCLVLSCSTKAVT